jgi:carbonic anhydrase
VLHRTVLVRELVIGWQQKMAIVVKLVLMNTLNADSALEKLVAGNQRYVNDRLSHYHQSGSRMRAISAEQHPFAIILGCADSRVPPEIIFDLGLGDLFVIRVAGNILDDAILGSIEYAVEELGTSLVLVLGHERCGAVIATVKHARVLGHISMLIEAIQPAVDRVKNQPGDLLDNAVRANIELVVEQLKSSMPVAKLVQHAKLDIVGAQYKLDCGTVEIIA